MTAAKRTARDVGLRQLKSGRWQARYRDAEGVDQRGTFATKREAKVWRDGQVADVQRGMHVSPSDTRTVAEWATSWVEGRPLRPGTTKRYKGMISAHLADTPLGRQRLVDVRTSNVQAWVASRSTVLAPSTLGRVYTFLQSIFKAAQADRIIVWSPCSGVRLPEAERVDHLLVTAEQVDAIEDAIPARYKALVRLLAATGLRIGEALALYPDDIDRDAQVIHVRRTLDQAGRAMGPVKSARHSRRAVPVEGSVLALLAAHRLAHPPSWIPDEMLGGLLFTARRGRPMRYDVVHRVFARAAATAGAEGVTPHSLRHYCGSSMLADGIPPASVAKALGHSVETLHRHYAHAMPDGDDLVRASMARRARPNASSHLRAAK